MGKYKALTASMLALLFLAACGSSGMGDILGGGSNQSNRYEIRGTVESVDLNSRSIYLTNVTGYTSMLSNGGTSGGSTVRVYYDDQTSVDYQGRSYRPQDLERGDQVAARVDESGNSLLASSMTVVSDVSGGTNNGSYPNDTYGTTVRGTVRNVDTSRRTIEVDRGYGSSVIVEYDNATPVYFDGKTYRAADRERGDEIEIRTRDLGSGRLSAQDVTVTRNISGGTYGSGTGSSTSSSVVRGTVRYVDTSRRTIELESATWASGFNSGAGSGNRVVIQYDSNASVDVSGQLQPIAGLEQGDVIEVRVQNLGNGSLLADRIYLVRDVRR